MVQDTGTLLEQPGGNKTKTVIIIAIMVVVLLCCCCVFGVGGWWLWNNGDALFSGMGANNLLALI